MIYKHRTIIAVCVAVILVNGLVRFFWISPLKNDVAALENQSVALRSNRHKPVQNVSDRFHQKKLDTQIVTGSLPAEFSFSSQVLKLWRIIERNGLSANESLVFTPETSERLSLVKYSTTLSLNGEYGKLKKVIADLENQPGIFLINGLKLTRSEKGRRSVELSIGLSMYFKEGFNG